MPVTTIGIGDGGNEIGLGALPWEHLCRAILQGPAERIACRVATDHTLLAVVSNWAGYALALATTALRERTHLAGGWNCQKQRKLITALVQTGGAVGWSHPAARSHRRRTAAGDLPAKSRCIATRLLPLSVTSPLS